MIIEILANAGQVSLYVNAVRAQMRRWPNAGEHQQLRGANRPRTQHHFAPSHGCHTGASRIKKNNTCCNLVLNGNCRDKRPGDNRQIAAAACWC